MSLRAEVERQPVPADDDLPHQLASGYPAYTMFGPEDWVTYGDHLVVLTATEEWRLPPEEDPTLPAGDGLAFRMLDLSFSDPLWSRQGAPPAPTGLELDWGGWIVVDGEDVAALGWEDAPSIEVGVPYLAMISFDGADSVYPWIVSAMTMIPYASETIGEGDTIDTHHGPLTPETASEVAEEEEPDLRLSVWGQDASALVAVLEAAAPHPEVVPYLDRPVRERYDARWGQE